MGSEEDRDAANREIAERWCATRGRRWKLVDQAGRGGTAPVFGLQGPKGHFAFKILDPAFSAPPLREQTAKRIEQQKALGDHDCPHLVKIYDGGEFEGRFFLLMNRAPGKELEKRLREIPRDKIRGIIDKVAKACIYLRTKGFCHRDVKSANIFVSDDFEEVTLLDLSVMREIADPIGAGTDHGGQLPVVATSRYSPPEYLFRLVDPGPDLWHAVDVYQLGGLIHDLVMQEPLFEAQYVLSKENRYRFAWVVATVDPRVEASDVDQDIVVLGRRALDKNWMRRSQLTLEDFLDSEVNVRTHGLEALGLGARPRSSPERVAARSAHSRILEMAKALEKGVNEYLGRLGVTATHDVEAGGIDAEKVLTFEWDATKSGGLSDVCLTYEVRLRVGPDTASFEIAAHLEALADGTRRSVSLLLPQVSEGDEAIGILLAHATDAIGKLASDIIKANGREEGQRNVSLVD